MAQHEFTTSRDEVERITARSELARALAQGGFGPVQVISIEAANDVLTPRRVEILETLACEEVKSVRDLARRLGRDKGQVSRELGTLVKHGIVRFERVGAAKKPTLTQERIVVEPIV